MFGVNRSSFASLPFHPLLAVLRALLGVLFVILLTPSLARAEPYPPTHNPAHCSPEIVAKVAQGLMDKNWYNGNWVVSFGQGIVCILNYSSQAQAWIERTTYPLATQGGRTAEERAAQIAAAKKATEIAASELKVKLAGKAVLSRAPVLLVVPTALIDPNCWRGQTNICIDARCYTKSGGKWYNTCKGVIQ